MRAPLLLLLAAAAVLPAADDVVVLLDGVEIIGTVEVDDARHVVVVIDGGRRVTLDRAQVGHVRRGAGAGRPASGGLEARQEVDTAPPARRPTPLAEDPILLAIEGGPRRLSVTAGLGLSAIAGTADSTGRLVDNSLGGSARLIGEYELGGLRPLPGLSLRATWDGGPRAAGPRLGVQFAAGGAAAEDAELRALNAAALAGWSWGNLRRRHAIQGLAGWSMADFERTIRLRDGAGNLLDQVVDTAELSGPFLAIEAETAWLRGPWLWGLSIGASWQSLSGDTTWDSAAGLYSGSEDIDASLIGVYATGFAGFRF
jgi:hypothetical protein